MNDVLQGLAFVAAAAEEGGAIYSYRVDTESDAGIRYLRETSIGEAPSYLTVHPENHVLYAVDRDHGGTVHALDIDPETGSLSRIATRSTGSEGPCYCSIDRRREYLLVAHYSGGSVSTLPIGSNGALEDPCHVVGHDGDTPHPHAIVPHPDCERIYVPDLGIDAIVEYELDRESGYLNRVGSVLVRDGSGPRHFVFHPDRDLAFLTNEGDSTLTNFACGSAGDLSPIETVDTSPAGLDDENDPADIHVHPDGQYVYVSNRGHDSVAVFRIDEDGHLERLDHEPTRGECPRDFVIAPNGRYLYVENKDTNTIVPFSIDAATGGLTQRGEIFKVPTPSCMTFTATAANPII